MKKRLQDIWISLRKSFTDNGSTTIFTVIIMSSLVLLVIMFVSVTRMKAETGRADALLSLSARSVLSEYSISLKERYGLLAVDTTPTAIEEDMRFYMGENDSSLDISEMNTHISVSTIPHPTGWHTINWKACHARVRKLQLRIAKATRQQQWRQVRELQRILTRSFSGKAVAVRRVTENTGKRTPGIDGKIWHTPKEKWEGICSLNLCGYRPQPLRRIHIPKSNGKTRPLGIPTMRDRAMQALWLLALEPVSETTADHNSYGFRPMRSTHDAIESIFLRMSQKVSPKWILEGDIKGCFDNISHDWLLSHIPMDRRLLKKWLKAGYMERGVFNHTNSGTPQGGIISPVLANMALDGLEKELMQTFRKSGYHSAKHQVNYVRYADDFIFYDGQRMSCP